MSNQHGYSKLLAKLGSDHRWAFALFILGILSRLPFRSHMLYHWDSVNFALAVEKFDMLLHQPHPPGFFLYVLLGRWATQLAGDVNAGYVWISVLCSGLGAAAIFYLGRALFERTVGILTALLFLSSPSIWFHGEIALTYILEAFMVVVMVLLWWLMLRQTRPRWLVLGSIAMGLSGGFRLPSMVLLAPLYLFALRKYSRKWVLFALLLTSTCILVWLVPTAYQIGGLDRYIKAVFNLSSLSHSASQKELNPSVLFGRDPAYQAMGRLGMYMVYGLLGGLLPFGYLLSRRGLAWLKSVRRLIKDERVHVLVLWLLPILLIWAPRVKASGHTLSFLPGLLLLAGWGLTILRNDLTKRLSWKVSNIPVAGIILVNLGFFFLAPPYLFGDRRVAFTTPSYPTIHHRDQCLSERIEFIKQNFSPSNTAIWVSGFDFRHPDYYLRDYTLLGHVEDISPWANLPTEIQKLVVFSEDLNKIAATYNGTEATALPGGEFIYTLTAPHYGRSSTVTGAPD